MTRIALTFKACYKSTGCNVEELGQILQIHGYILQMRPNEKYVPGLYST
ncbi:MAG: hypothetical protein RLZ91_527 [Bacteroidota bacterium]